jgi:hypothetical protein
MGRTSGSSRRGSELLAPMAGSTDDALDETLLRALRVLRVLATLSVLARLLLLLGMSRSLSLL